MSPSPILRFVACVQGAGSQTALSVSFEQATERLAALPRLFIEPDGSFVWTGVTVEGEPWQVDGNLIDRGDVLAYVELKGHCSSEQFDELLRAFGWPGEKIVFQLTRRGVALTEDEFRQLAATGEGAV
jgi:hypothetical protein